MMLRAIFLLFFLSLSFSARSECSAEKLTQFHQVWKLFYSAALTEKAEEISYFFKFPLKLLSPFDNEKPIVINKSIFIKNYSYIFLQTVPGQDNEVYENFKQFKNMSGTQFRNAVDTSSCDANPQSGTLISVGDYHFIWNASNGWLIYAIDYPGVQRRNLKYSFIHKTLR